MPEEIPTPTASLIPAEPIPPEAAALFHKVQSMMDGQHKEQTEVELQLEGMEGIFDLIASGLYSIASMLVGEGEDSIILVETAVANAEVSACSNPEQARLSSRRVLAAAAIELLARRDPESLSAPEGLEPVVTCLEDDALDAASEAQNDVSRMIAGPDRDRVRNWLASLPVSLRTIYVLRAVAGFTAPETAGLLASHGGAQAAAWTPDAVRELFRQGLCSLASQLIHASSGR